MKKIYNINEMRQVLVNAHNDNNKKAINLDMVSGAGIDVAYFTKWKNDIEALRKITLAYVMKKHDPAATNEEIDELRGKIYPKWKTILEAGEEKKTVKTFSCREYDVDSIVGYCETFVSTACGTAQAGTSETMFRKKIESLIGCKIAKNAVLNDTQRDTLDAYYKALSGLTRIENMIAEADKEKNALSLILKENSSDDLKKYIESAIDDKNTLIKDLNEKKGEQEIKIKTLAPKAKAIELTLRKIK